MEEEVHKIRRITKCLPPKFCDIEIHQWGNEITVTRRHLHKSKIRVEGETWIGKTLVRKWIKYE